jgi:ubiquinone/menaquinone biosynthesis C-methylase UbiE
MTDAVDVVKEKSASDKDYFNKLSKEYFTRHEQPIQRYTTELESMWLKRLVLPYSKVLLVGSGGGRELRALLANDCKVVALDYSDDMLNIGKRMWGTDNIQWVLGDVHDLSRYKNKFNYVISLAALNYFVDINLALFNMRNALLPGGMLIVSSINALHVSERRLKGNSKFNRKTYTPVELINLVAKAQLVIKEVRGFRYLVDSLPSKWNQQEANIMQKILLNLALQLENLFRLFSKPEKAKFFWLIAERPCTC